MSRRNDHSTDIDPFNAGEPTLPWDDPATLHDDPTECTFEGEVSYRAPSKTAEKYRAPKKRPERAERSSAPKDELASKAPRAHGNLSLKLALLILIIFGLAGGIIGAVGSCASNAFHRMDLTADELLNNSADDDASWSGQDDGEPQTKFSEAEAAVRDCVLARLDTLDNDDRARSMIAGGLSSSLENTLGYTADELSIDSASWVGAKLSQLSYSTDSAFAFDDEGSVYIYVSVPRTDELVDLFAEQAEPILSKLDGAAPSNADKEQLSACFETTLAKKIDVNELFLRFVAKPKGAGWQIDEDRFYSELEYVLG